MTLGVNETFSHVIYHKSFIHLFSGLGSLRTEITFKHIREN